MASSGHLRSFAHLNADKAELYRCVLLAFVQAKERFLLHLRPGEVASALASSGLRLDPPQLDALLGPLCGWGNLEAQPDTAEVGTVEDFYRPRYLYQLTAEGEAVERALQAYHAFLDQPGELQTAALADILALLRELEQVGAVEPLDEGKVFRSLKLLCTRLEELTSRAQSFLRSLQRTIDLQGVTVEGFLAYKERLIDYLERFIAELVVAGGAIAQSLEDLEGRGTRRLLEAAARRERADALDASLEGRATALSTWQGRWDGLRGWFLNRGETPSQAETLRARARASIPALLATVANLHDRRLTHTDRSSDWRALARWFAELDSDRDAHRLWRAATALPPARHLITDERSLERWELDGVGPQDGWLEATPLRISMRLRATGRYTRRGRTNDVIDKSREKAELARLARLEAEQLELAQRRLATGRPLRLSQLVTLDPLEFGLLLDLLGEALALKVGPRDVAQTSSSDGGLRITLAPLLEDPDAEMVLEVPGLGWLRGPDHLVTICRLGARDEEAAA